MASPSRPDLAPERTTSDGLIDAMTALICAIGVMLFVEIPLVAMFVRPGGVVAEIKRFESWLKRNGWSLAAGFALIAGIYAIVEGIDALT